MGERENGCEILHQAMGQTQGLERGNDTTLHKRLAQNVPVHDYNLKAVIELFCVGFASPNVLEKDLGALKSENEMRKATRETARIQHDTHVQTRKATLITPHTTHTPQAKQSTQSWHAGA